MKIKKAYLTMFSLGYIYIPIVIFLAGWLKLWYAIICAGVLFGVAYRFLGKYLLKKEYDSYVHVEWEIVVIAVLLFLWIGYYAGWGRWVAQSGDWNKHNAILYDLVNSSWPVYYKNGDEHSMLVYYIAQYIVPAIVGKVTHSVRIAEIFNYIWAEIGLFLVWLNLIATIDIKKYLIKFTSPFVLVFFSTPLWISELVMKRLLGINQIGSGQWFFFDSEGILLQYSSNYVMLRWVFPQVIVIWMMVLLLMQHKDKIEFYLFLLLPGVLFATLSFVGLVPVGVFFSIEWLRENKSFKRWMCKIFSIENILTLFSIGSVLCLYFYGNIFSSKPDSIGLMRQPYDGKLGIFWCFIGVNVLLYGILLWWDNKKNLIFYITIISLSVIPLFKMGLYNDFGMRCSIVFLFLLMIYIVQFIDKNIGNENNKKYRNFITGALVMLLISGMYYPFQELSESVASEEYGVMGNDIGWDTMQQFANREGEGYGDDLKYNYYAYDIENNFFYNYLAR